MSTKWLAAMFLLSFALLGGVGARALARVGIHQGYRPAQPIAFSHRLHSGEHQVPCLYCHFTAGRSRHAGIPPTSVCMNCHALLTRQTAEIAKLTEALAQRRPIEWVKVHNLPDFVHFDHRPHVWAGLACQRCHGAVEAMERVGQTAPLTMGWCLECHRERHVEGGEDCGKCHH